MIVKGLDVARSNVPVARDRSRRGLAAATCLSPLDWGWRATGNSGSIGYMTQTKPSDAIPATLYRALGATVEPAILKQPSLRSARDGASLRILVVDDELAVVARTRELLAGEGYATLGAGRGHEALTLAESWLPHLVLLGWGLPDLDGREVCRRLKATAAGSECLVVMASASHPSADDQIAGLESGADGYLVRPIPDRELVARVRAFARIARNNIELREQAERGRAAEESLRDNQERYRILADGVTEVVWILNARNLRFLFVSPSVERLNGYTVAETVDKPLHALVPPAAWWSLKRLVRRRAGAYAGDPLGGRLYKSELELPCKCGGTVWTETVASFERHPRTGQPVLRGVTRDIGERKAVEAALAETHRRLSALLENLPGFAYRRSNDADWTGEFASRGCRDLAGYPAEDLVGPHGLNFLSLVHPHDRERVRAEVAESLRTRRPYALAYRIVSANGAEKQVWDGGRGIYGPGGETLAMEGLVLHGDPRHCAELERLRAESDIRELNAELERRVQERTAALEATNAELQAYAFSISHDLRAPLRAICGFAHILSQRAQDRLDREGRHYLERVIAAGERMGHLIDDLLAYARIGQGAVRCQPVPLDRLLTEIRSTLADRIVESGAEIVVQEPLAMPLGDPTLVSQILSNLIENALTYRSHTGTPRVEISALCDGVAVTLRVTDNGIGIAPEHHGQIFQVFHRLHSEDAYPGTGIGLAIVAKAARMLGGKIEVRSALGHGSTFAVTLPVPASNEAL
jgi:PAS domain S-box-containing protein